MTNRRALNHLAKPSSSRLGLRCVSPICLKYQTLCHDVISAWPELRSCISDGNAGAIARYREPYPNQCPIEPEELRQHYIAVQTEGAQHHQEAQPNDK